MPSTEFFQLGKGNPGGRTCPAFGFMITGFLLIGVGIALVYREICKIELSKAVAVAAQSGAINELRRLLTSNSGNIELVDRMDLILEGLQAPQADRKVGYDPGKATGPARRGGFSE